MVDPISIGAAWTFTKEIINTGKRIFDLKVSDEVRKEVQYMIDKTSDLYDKIVSLEEERKLNRELISELEHKIKKAKNFKREFKKYKPHQFSTGSFVYCYNSLVNKDKPMHYICTNCIDNEIISVLQPPDKGNFFICHKCKSTFSFKKNELKINPIIFNHL